MLWRLRGWHARHSDGIRLHNVLPRSRGVALKKRNDTDPSVHRKTGQGDLGIATVPDPRIGDGAFLALSLYRHAGSGAKQIPVPSAEFCCAVFGYVMAPSRECHRRLPTSIGNNFEAKPEPHSLGRRSREYLHSINSSCRIPTVEVRIRDLSFFVTAKQRSDRVRQVFFSFN